MGEGRTVAEVAGQHVSALRQAAGLTQAELAEAMREIGFAWQRQTVAQVERGERLLNVDELVAIAAYFEMPIGSILAVPDVLGRGAPPVQIRTRSLSARDWTHLVWQEGRTHDEAAGGAARRAIDAIVAGLRRPWARYWRRGAARDAAFQRARNERGDMKRSGPIFVADEDIALSGDRPIGAGEPIQLKAGEPYTARDEFEAERLRGEPRIRMITKQQAYRMRHRARER